MESHIKAHSVTGGEVYLLAVAVVINRRMKKRVMSQLPPM
jgi:hypothetical protein